MRFLSLLLAFALSPAASAQFLLYGGVSDAVNQFGDTNGRGAGYAGYGLVAGFDYEVPSRYERGLDVVIGAALITSSVQTDALFDDGILTETDPDLQPYISVPVGFGFRYRLFDEARLTPVLEGKVLYTYNRFPRVELRDPATGVSIEQEADGAGGFGFGAGLVLGVGRRLDVGVRYYGMGTRTFDTEANADVPGGPDPTIRLRGDQPVSVTVLFAGFRL